MKNKHVPKNVLNQRVKQQSNDIKLSKETLEYVQRTRQAFYDKLRDPNENYLMEKGLNGVYCGPTTKK